MDLNPDQNFTLAYDSNIPRQAGLSGSSGIVTAALNCLLKHYQIEDHVPVHDRPGLVLSAENELGITAGLQDRVIQVGPWNQPWRVCRASFNLEVGQRPASCMANKYTAQGCTTLDPAGRASSWPMACCTNCLLGGIWRQDVWGCYTTT